MTADVLRGSRPVPDPARVRQAVAVLAAAAGLLGLVGFAVSFERVSTAAWASFGALAPAVPVGVDLGILVFSALGVLLAYLDMPAWWLRPVPVGLTAATIALNVAGEHDLFGVVAHAVLPCLWVLVVAVAEHVVRHRLALDGGRRMDRVRFSRWLLAPVPTFMLWRRMVLWECRSYTEAIERERRRLLATAALRDAYGRKWRTHAPRRLRVAHRLGDLTPDHVHTATTPPPAPISTPPASGSGDGRPAGRRGMRSAGRAGTNAGRVGGRSGGSVARSMEELRAQLRAAIEVGRVGARPSAEAIRRELACAPGKARTLRDEVAADPAGAVLATIGPAAGSGEGVEREGAA